MAMRNLFTWTLLMLALLPGKAAAHDFTVNGTTSTINKSGNHDAIPGDVNGDGTVSIADINAVINIILGDAEPVAAADVGGDGEITLADVNALIDIILGLDVEPQPQHEWVDLGLPSGTLWATCNVGADSPEQSGDYFAWGETKPKRTYEWATYKWCDGSENTLTKYCPSSDWGTVDNLMRLEPQDDAATVNWGPMWRTPTYEQIQELNTKSTWKWTTINGKSGYLITGPNGNTIFLPNTGTREGSSPAAWNSCYWSSDICSVNSPCHAYGQDFNSWGTSWIGNHRYIGCAVRPVRVSLSDVYIEQQILELGAAPIGETYSGRLYIGNCTPQALTMTATVDEPFTLLQDEGTVSSVTIEIAGNTSATVAVMFKATTPGDYSGRLTVNCPALEGGLQVIDVHALALNDDMMQQQWVDLGMPSGTLWATRDIGASSPEQDGDRLAWGESTPKESYQWTNYKWSDCTGYTMTKYCTSSDWGSVDNLTELEAEDDAATVNWGPMWHMPSVNQIQELIDCCTFTTTLYCGAIVHMAKGPNGKRLFFPAESRYWSNSIDSQLPYYAWNLNLDWPKAVIWGSSRCNGLKVRAVRAPLD